MGRKIGNKAMKSKLRIVKTRKQRYIQRYKVRDREMNRDRDEKSNFRKKEAEKEKQRQMKRCKDSA